MIKLLPLLTVIIITSLPGVRLPIHLHSFQAHLIS
uniref:Uncharacterized protein n=1 Tax=Anguilla anguilla TaxID=7936 RepID=A0A0E9VWY9_ANGAN